MWISKIEKGLEPDANPFEVNEGQKPAWKLRGKLGQFDDAAMAQRVDDILELHRQRYRSD